MSEPKDPVDQPPEGAPEKQAQPEAEVVPIEEARKRSEERAAQSAEPPAASTPAAAVLAPVMQAVLRELAGLAGPDGNIKLGGEDAAARAKTAAVLKGIGAGLGAALADAFGKWAEKLVQPPAAAAPPERSGDKLAEKSVEKPADPARPEDPKPDPPKSN